MWHLTVPFSRPGCLPASQTTLLVPHPSQVGGAVWSPSTAPASPSNLYQPGCNEASSEIQIENLEWFKGGRIKEQLRQRQDNCHMWTSEQVFFYNLQGQESCLVLIHNLLCLTKFPPPFKTLWLSLPLGIYHSYIPPQEPEVAFQSSSSSRRGQSSWHKDCCHLDPGSGRRRRRH